MKIIATPKIDPPNNIAPAASGFVIIDETKVPAIENTPTAMNIPPIIPQTISHSTYMSALLNAVPQGIDILMHPNCEVVSKMLISDGCNLYFQL